MQRVWFCIYDPHDELNLRDKLEEFEAATLKSSRNGPNMTLQTALPSGFSGHKYAEQYFKNPSLLNTILADYKSYLVNIISQQIKESQADGNTVLALPYGVGSLFGFLKVKELVESCPTGTGQACSVLSRTHENNTYRLLDGYDGWGYLAVPITSEKEL